MAASCRTGRKDRAQLNDATPLERADSENRRCLPVGEEKRICDPRSGRTDFGTERGLLCVSSCRLPTNQGPGLGSRLGFALDRVLLLEAIITGKPAQDPVLRPIL